MKNANTVSRVLRTALLGVLLCGLTACDQSSTSKVEATKRAVKDADAFFPVKVGTELVAMQLALTPGEQMRGLMGRRDLQENQGMIFVTPQAEQKNFYMRNTPTPLDIAYIDPAGVIREIYALHPFDETTVSSRSKFLKFALEVNQGWFGKHGVKVGDSIDLVAVAEAIEARGFSPRNFGLGAK